MALQKQPINLAFNQGVNTKTDPYQLPIGQFQSLTNCIFTKDGLMQKRNGYELLTAAPLGAQTLCTLNDGLVILGNTCQSYSQDSGKLTNSGLFQPLSMSVAPMVRRATSQTTCDIAVAPSGLACSVWLDANGNSYYQISDSATGQIVIPAVPLPTGAVSCRVFVLGVYFIVTFIATVSAVATYQYIAIPINNPNLPKAAVTISALANNYTAPNDGFSVDDTLYLTLYCSDSMIKTWYLTQNLQISAPTSVSATALRISIAYDYYLNTVWVTYSTSTTVAAFAMVSTLGTPILAATTIASGISSGIAQVISSASNGILTAVYEIINAYSYTPAAPEASDTKTDYVQQNTLTLGGTAGTPALVSRGIGLASKAILLYTYTLNSAPNTQITATQLPSSAFTLVSKNLYFLTCYGQQFQPTYFLMDLAGDVLARLAYANGIGYPATQILPTINYNGALQVGYLYADLLQAINKTQGASTTGVYSQYGINLATMTLGGQTAALAIGGSLHASGGMLWQYDGVKAREFGFNVWPEDIGVAASTTVGSMAAQQYFYQVTYEWTDAAGQVHRSAPSVPITFTIDTAPTSFTGNRTSGSPTLTGVSSFTNLQIGQVISGTGIPTNTFISALNPGSSTITMSANASSGTNTSTTVTPTSISALTLNIPTLRQTYKTDNAVRIVIYRWSTQNQEYYQITSVSSPLLNNPLVDSVTYTDSQVDNSIVGNNIIYTTGGVIEDICAPAAAAMTLWQSRLFLADAEDPNLIWFSKQVIEATPVEMSDLLTLFIAPTTGAQGSTGPITALASMDDKLVIFKADAIYYITGTGPDNTGNNGTFSDPVFVTSTVGCANPQSIVLTPNGIMFQSDKGIWILGRDLSTVYIGAAVESYTLGNTVTSALCIPATNQVRFTMNNNTAVMFDYFFNRWANWTNIPAISSAVYEGAQAYLNAYGEIVKETPGAFLDISTPVLLALTTGWINLAGVQGFERFYAMNLLGTYYTPYTLNVQIAYDYNPSALQSTIVYPEKFTPNYGNNANWGAGQPWGGNGNVFSARVFPQKQKTQSFQVSINEIYDSSYGTEVGAGLTLSGLLLLVGMKRGSRTQSAAKSFG